MSRDIHLAHVRSRLIPRREPYWGPPIEQGKHIGVRKLANGTCTWIARRYDDDQSAYRYKSLGQLSKAFNYNQAKRSADSWFADADLGVLDKTPTVEDACKDYVADLEAEGRIDAAHDSKMRFKRTVYSHDIAKIPLDKLRTTKLKTWKNGLGGAKSSQNRNLTSLKAALNHAVAHHLVNPSVSQQWKAVKAHKGAFNRRELYLDLKQRRALLKAAKGAVRDLIEAAMLTGARPGELVRAKRSQFDHRTSSMKFTGKTGSRTVPLSVSALDVFKRLSKGKLPTAFLLTRDDGQPWGHSDWDQLVRDAAEKAELPKGVVLYTLRHSWITEALRSGMPTLDVARLTGTSLPMIEAHYGHLVVDAARERLASFKML